MRNFEIKGVSEKHKVGGGALKRLTVAPVLDGGKGDKGMVIKPREELDKLPTLVRSSAGASETRGDAVTVESMVFASTADAPAEGAIPAPIAQDRWHAAQRWAT